MADDATRETAGMTAEDEELAQRFLVGDVSAGERAAVETRMLQDDGYFEAVCALEHDMIVSHVRGALPDRWRARFEAAYLESPRRRQRVEEVRALVAALAATPGSPREFPSSPREFPRDVSVKAGAPQRPVARPSAWQQRRFLAAAAVALVAVGGVLVRHSLTRDSLERAPTGLGAPTETPSREPAVVFHLVRDLTRSEAPQKNIFPGPTGVREIALATTVDSRAPSRMAAEIRNVGAARVFRARAESAPKPDGSRGVVVRVPATALPPGDYVVTLRAEGDDEGEPVARIFFSIVG